MVIDATNLLKIIVLSIDYIGPVFKFIILTQYFWRHSGVNCYNNLLIELI